MCGIEETFGSCWLRTHSSAATLTVQHSVASEGGSGTAVPDTSIEVDDIEEALLIVRNASLPIAYGPAIHLWDIRKLDVPDLFEDWSTFCA